MALLRRVTGIALFLSLLVGAVLLRDANDQRIDIDYVFGTVTNVSLWLVLVASFATGAALATLILTTRLARGSLAQRRYRRAVARLEQEVHQLRNLPVADGPQLDPAADGSDGGP